MVIDTVELHQKVVKERDVCVFTIQSHNGGIPHCESLFQRHLEDAMKRFILVSLAIGTGLVFFGCSEADPTAPEMNQHAQLPAPLEKISVTNFSGTSETILQHAPGTSTPLPGGGVFNKGIVVETRDELDDPRVNGNVVWVVNAIFDAEGFGTLWGTGELIIPGVGKWDMKYVGWLTSDGLTYEVGGRGRDGLKGSVAHWTYVMTAPSHFNVEGFIIARK
jgi:hypothetical protein